MLIWMYEVIHVALEASWKKIFIAECNKERQYNESVFSVSEVYRSTAFSVENIQRLIERYIHSQKSTDNGSQVQPLTNISLYKMIHCQQLSEEKCLLL